MKLITLILILVFNLYSNELNTYKFNMIKYIKDNDKISFTEFKSITKQYNKKDLKKCINKFSKQFKVPKKAFDSIIYMENSKRITYAINCNTNIKPYSSSIYRNYLNYLYCKNDNVDVGIMQINLKVWKREDENLTFDKLLNPCYNIFYGMKIISKHYKETNNWVKTLGYYHSRTPKHFNNYVDGIRKFLHK